MEGEVLAVILNVAVLAFVVTSMLAMGFSLTLPEIREPLSNWKLVSLALLANFPHPAAVAWLLAHGADVAVRMDDGRTPLHRAAERNASDKVARMLVEAGADPSAKDEAGKRPIDYAHGSPASGEAR